MRVRCVSVIGLCTSAAAAHAHTYKGPLPLPPSGESGGDTVTPYPTDCPFAAFYRVPYLLLTHVRRRVSGMRRSRASAAAARSGGR